MKKILAMLISFAICFSLTVCFAGCAPKEDENQNITMTEKEASKVFTFYIENDYVVIDSYFGEKKELVIPAKIVIENKEYEVAVIGEMSLDNGDITKVTIPSTVVTIEKYAFWTCDRLQTVVIADNSKLKTIEERAFEQCGYLETISFGANSVLEDIGEHAFEKCESLKSIQIPANVKSISDYTFSYCTSLKTVGFANNSKLEEIGGRAFSYCYALESISIPDNVWLVYNYAFSMCTSLKSVTFGQNSAIREIGDGVFGGCTALASIIIPNGVEFLHYSVFYGCTDTNVFCEAESKPLGWHHNWYDGTKGVYWYSPDQPTQAGNYWRYVNGIPTNW